MTFCFVSFICTYKLPTDLALAYFLGHYRKNLEKFSNDGNCHQKELQELRNVVCYLYVNQRSGCIFCLFSKPGAIFPRIKLANFPYFQQVSEFLQQNNQTIQFTVHKILSIVRLHNYYPTSSIFILYLYAGN